MEKIIRKENFTPLLVFVALLLLKIGSIVALVSVHTPHHTSQATPFPVHKNYYNGKEKN